MPTTTSFDQLNRVITVFTEKASSPDLVTFLGEKLSAHIANAYYASGLKDRTGTLSKNIQYVSPPERSGSGWSVKVGKGVGNPKDAAPRGTIKAFLEWYRGKTSKSRGRGNGSWAFAWWYLSSKEKEVLQQQREAGRFGGETTYAVERSPYIWSHDMGNAKANIRGRGFINEGIASWRKNVNDYVREYMNLSR